MTTKDGLRRLARRLAPPSEEESAAVVAGVARWLESHTPTTVLVYLSMPGEIPAERVVDAAAGRHRFAVTRTPDAGWLTVHGFDAPRERHRFGFYQPVASAPTVPLASIGVVLAPGVAFDLGGARLGWGRGYYDELLSRIPGSAARVGITLERRLYPAIPSEPHDVAMTHLATESGVRTL